MGKRALTVLFALVLCLAAPGYGETLDKTDFHARKDGMPGEQQCDKVIRVGKGVPLHAIVNVTVRGNGHLTIGNLKDIKVWNEGSDGTSYAGDLLHVEFVDLTGDGYEDLVITGIVVVDEGDTGKGPYSYSPVTEIFVFDPGKKEFHRVFHCGRDIDG